MLTDNNQIFRNCFVIIYCHLTKVSSQINKRVIFGPDELSVTLSTLWSLLSEAVDELPNKPNQAPIIYPLSPVETGTTGEAHFHVDNHTSVVNRFALLKIIQSLLRCRMHAILKGDQLEEVDCFKFLG